MRKLLRVFFHFLYNQFAFAYDFVAAAVSLGHWKNWILEVIPFIAGTRTLEIGHGPGHLQRFLLSRGLDSVAIDKSSSMGRLAKRNVVSIRPAKAGEATQPPVQLTRGLAQYLPFADQSFDTIIATFPAEYFVDPLTLSEVGRCLSDGGRFVVLPAALPKNRLLSWLFKVTGQASSEAMEIIQEKMEKPFVKAGFAVETNVIEKESGTLIVLIATKQPAELSFRPP